VIATETPGFHPPQATMVREHLYVVSDRGGIVRRFLVIWNRECKAPMPDTTLEKIRCAFTL
jgi:hypothetical protein